MDPLILSWWGSEFRIVYPSGEIRISNFDEAKDPVSAIVLLLETEKNEFKKIRIVYFSDKLILNSIKHLQIPIPIGADSKRKRSKLKGLLLTHYPQLSHADSSWSLTYDLRISPYFTSLAIIKNSHLTSLCKQLITLGYFIEGVWPMPFLMHASHTKLSHESGSLCVACTDENLMITTVSLSGDWQCDNYDAKSNESITLTGLRNARLRFEDEANPGGWVATDSSSEKNPLIYHCKELGLSNLMLSHMFYSLRYIPVKSWENMYTNLATDQSDGLSLKTINIFTVLIVTCLGTYLWYHSITVRNSLIEKNKAHAIEDESISKEKFARDVKTRMEIIIHDFKLSLVEPELVHTLFSQIGLTLSKRISITKLYYKNNIIVIESDTKEKLKSKHSGAELCQLLNTATTKWSFSVEQDSTQDTALKLIGARLKIYVKESDITDSKFQELKEKLPKSDDLNQLLKSLAEHWSLSIDESDSFTDFKIQHISLNYINPQIDDWSNVVLTLKTLSTLNRLTIDEVLLVRDRDNPGLFKEARIKLSSRIKS
jgi:hypothetical protein